ncbi:MAG: tetratricopeptide repeat protein [Gemmatimonadota bacterium]|nr:tetratricopeptide repeat protein [Gemmatimonadota bacterium]
MANVAALKKKAADLEAKKQVDKAIAAYREVLDAYDRGEDAEPEIALYNRVGDLLSRQGNAAEAVMLYERAVDLYTEGGFFNNAIALCNKVLRTSPGRASIYYKLGKISAAKGFKGEAKQNFLEYADRMQKNGQMDEAFRALKEFAELVPDQDDVRLMLAEQLTRAGKQGEALQQLQVLYNRHEAEGRSDEAAATLERIKSIDPNFEPQASEKREKSKADDLVFIDLDAPPRRSTRSIRAHAPEPPKPAPPPPAPKPEAKPEAKPEIAAEAAPAPAPEPGSPPAGGMEGLELTSAIGAADVEVPAADASSLLGLEPTSLGDGTDAPVEDSEPLDAAEFGAIDLSTIQEARSERPGASKDLALGGELPRLDDAEAERISGSLLAMDDLSADRGGALPLIEADADLGVEPTALDDDTAGGTGLELISLDDDEKRPATADTDDVEEAPTTPTHYHEVEPEVVDEPPVPVRRSSSMLAANSVMTLRVKVEDEPENWDLRRKLGEALLEAGERDDGLRELEAALAGFDKANDIDGASSIADEIVRVDPSSIRYHQKRVEYAFRANDKGRTADAYLSLADALLRNGQTDRARTVYDRVLEIRPHDARATAALETLLPSPPAGVPAAGRPATPPRGKRYTGSVAPDKPVVTTKPDAAPAGGDEDLISLGDWLREDEGPKSTRMVVEEQEPTGDEQADFADMLKKFKQGISENVEEEDHEAHYDLGVAYKEMGLVDEAIAEFQKALRGTEHRARTYEALGQCFLEKKQLPVATTILQRALNEPGVGDEQLVGVLYLLGYIHESLHKPAEAKGYYERVFAVDIQFRDVGDRLNAVDKALK